MRQRRGETNRHTDRQTDRHTDRKSVTVERKRGNTQTVSNKGEAWTWFVALVATSTAWTVDRVRTVNKLRMRWWG